MCTCTLASHTQVTNTNNQQVTITSVTFTRHLFFDIIKHVCVAQKSRLFLFEIFGSDNNCPINTMGTYTESKWSPLNEIEVDKFFTWCLDQ